MKSQTLNPKEELPFGNRLFFGFSGFQHFFGFLVSDFGF
jgi:hypothetical protein